MTVWRCFRSVRELFGTPRLDFDRQNLSKRKRMCSCQRKLPSTCSNIDYSGWSAMRLRPSNHGRYDPIGRVGDPKPPAKALWEFNIGRREVVMGHSCPVDHAGAKHGGPCIATRRNETIRFPARVAT